MKFGQKYFKMDNPYNRLEEGEQNDIYKLREFISREDIKFGDFIVLDNALSLNQLEYFAKTLEIEVRFVIFENKTVCIVGKEDILPTYGEVLEILDQVNINEKPLIDLHNHPYLKGGVEYLDTVLPSFGDLVSSSTANIVGIISKDGLGLYPRCPVALYALITVKELLYDIHDLIYHPSKPKIDDLIKSAKGMKRILLQARVHLDKSGLEADIKVQEIEKLFEEIQKPEHLEKAIKVISIFLEHCLKDPLEQFQFTWKNLDGKDLNQFIREKSNLWKDNYPFF